MSKELGLSPHSTGSSWTQISKLYSQGWETRSNWLNVFSTNFLICKMGIHRSW